eukprot:TRINITY_DN81508_c0_g1_i1.p1 TRINITY_DN81508_c0_g1~~TRINITY_DN81508_c0_g1_i1.p1  ORF type:complete len:525 (+),score=78.55 TRINITY_DN81508_c0_g1_i1:131-1705(+)
MGQHTRHEATAAASFEPLLRSGRQYTSPAQVDAGSFLCQPGSSFQRSRSEEVGLALPRRNTRNRGLAALDDADAALHQFNDDSTRSASSGSSSRQTSFLPQHNPAPVSLPRTPAEEDSQEKQPLSGNEGCFSFSCWLERWLGDREKCCFFVNAVLCVISLVASCVIPVLVDFSKTAVLKGPQGEMVRTMPYSVLSVLTWEALVNVVLGSIAIVVMAQPRRAAWRGKKLRELLSPLWSLADMELHRNMVPLTLVYAIGDLATLLAIGRAGGPLYIAVSSTRLLFAAGLSSVILKREQKPWQWALLAEISFATAAYAFFGSRKSQSSSGDASGNFMDSAILSGIGFAVMKAFLSGISAVLTERKYKDFKSQSVWHANALLKMQSLAFALLLRPLDIYFSDGAHPICGEAVEASWCMSHTGWDWWTWAVLAGEISAGWLNVVVLTRMSAVAKFLCKTATAPTLYLLYSAKNWGGHQFDMNSFIAVMMIALGIFLYVVEPIRPKLTEQGQACWSGSYKMLRAGGSPRK